MAVPTIEKVNGNIFEPGIELKYGDMDKIKKARAKQKAYHLKNKTQCMEYYRKGKEVCCSYPGCKETNIRNLQLDHINNDGKERRKEMQIFMGWKYPKTSAGNALYEFLIKAKFPKNFKVQVLCAMHNLQKKRLFEYYKSIHPGQQKMF